MEKILLTGANTRAVACSLKKLGYQVYSADYFGVMDLKTCADKAESVLDQKPQKSCGRFTERFNTLAIEEMAMNMVDVVDGIICCAGASPNSFPAHKIIGNVDVELVEDKYRLMQKLEDFFIVPETHLVTDINDARDIVSGSPGKKFILKPRHGAGGYGVRMFEGGIQKQILDNTVRNDDDSIEMDVGNWILQEFIQGENVSASVLSTSEDAQTILTSTQIIGDEDLGQREPFGYCGNIVPYVSSLISETVEEVKIAKLAQKVVSHLSLTGSNGVDFILRNGEIYVVEVNPRLQGTFECAELALDINMAEAHLEACQGHLMKIPPHNKFAVKMVIHAHQRSQVGNLDFKGIYDRPNQGVIIEKGEPIATVLSSSTIMENAIYSARKLVGKVYNSIKPIV